MTAQLKKFKGDSNIYTEVATRGAETMGLCLDYAIHGSGVGCLIVRFVAYSTTKAFEPFNHFVMRQHAQFKALDDAGATLKGEDGHSVKFLGVRLNKIAVPMFNPGPPSAFVAQFLDSFSMYPVLADWIAEQIQADGFTLTVPTLVTLLQDALTVPLSKPEDSKMVLDFPDLAAYHAEAGNAYAASQQPQAFDADEAVDEEDDEEEDEDTIN